MMGNDLGVRTHLPPAPDVVSRSFILVARTSCNMVKLRPGYRSLPDMVMPEGEELLVTSAPRVYFTAAAPTS